MNRYIKHKHLLQTLSCCSKRVRNAIIKSANKDEIFAICECILNVMNGNIKLNEVDYNKLKTYKNTFKKLLNKSPLSSKKKILVQKGGFLQILIPSIISGLASIISAAISKTTSD